MNKSAIRHSDDMLLRLSSRATIWMLGTGLLSLHASIFTLSMVGMVFWNVYDSPNNLWVDEIFRRWGVVLAFHAIAVAAGWTAWRLLRAEKQAIDAARTNWTPAILPASTQPIPPNHWRPQSGGPYPGSGPRSDSVAKRALVSYTTWSATMARRTKSVVSSSTSKWTSGRGNPPAGSNNGSTGSTQSWPEGPIRLRDDDQEFIAHFGGQSPPSSSNWLTTPPNHTPASGAAEPTTPSVSKEAGQTWVEAATGGWIAPRDDDQSSEHKRSNGHHPAPGTAPASGDSASAPGPQK